MSSPVNSHVRLGSRAWWPGLILALLIAAYVAYFGALTIQKHNAFQSTAFDLGNVDQAVWNTRHGRLLAMTNIPGLDNRLGTHVEPILLPLSLLYFLWSDPRVLLLLQTMVIGLGAWPVYLLARRQWADGQATRQGVGYLSALGFSLAYLLFPALQSANYFDFHAIALAPTFFLFALYFLEEGHWGAFVLFALLTMCCKEDAPLLVLMLGFYALLVRRRPWLGVATITWSLAWFGLAVGWIMPQFDTRGVSPLANRYAYLGDGPAEMVKTMVTQPGLVLEKLATRENLAYLRDLLAPMAFLSLLAPQVLVLALSSLAVNLLSTDGFMHQLEGFHYGAPLAPIAVVSAAYGAGWLCRQARRCGLLLPSLTILVLCASLLYHHGHGYTPLAAGWRDLWPGVTPHHHLGAEIAGEMPAEAPVAALPRLNPHVSQRERLLVIESVDEEGLPAPLQGAAGAWTADLVWLDVTNGWPLHPNDLQRGVQNLLAGEWGVERADDGWLLLHRGGTTKELPAGFYDFARAPEAQPQFPFLLQFFLPGDPTAETQPALECLGFDLEADARQGTHSLAIYWRALRPLPPGLRLYPFFFDDATGRIVEDTSQRPMVATVWYPPERWQPGEIVVTRTLPWDVGRDVAIGLGATLGKDWGAVDERLRLRLESSPAIVRLFDGDTWARVLGISDGRPVDEPRVFAQPSPGQPLQADFGGQVRLLGVDVDRDRANATAGVPGTLRLTFYWQALARMEASYAVFAQILGPDGAVRAQADQVPRNGGYPTTWWLPGEVVSDEVALALPSGFEPEGFRVIAGLYDPLTGTRLPVDGTGQDFAELEVGGP